LVVVRVKGMEYARQVVYGGIYMSERSSGKNLARVYSGQRAVRMASSEQAASKQEVSSKRAAGSENGKQQASRKYAVSRQQAGSKHGRADDMAVVDNRGNGMGGGERIGARIGRDIYGVEAKD
jgi:hypothetical protein